MRILHFAGRKKMTVITAGEALPAAPFTLSANVSNDGSLSLSINEKVNATGKAAGLLARTPADGLQVGEDLRDPVGDYAVPFKFGRDD